MRKRLILLVPFLALLALVATTEERAEATDVATRVEGEDFDVQPTGTKVVTDPTFYSPPDSQALKFTNNTAIVGAGKWAILRSHRGRLCNTLYVDF